MKQDFDPALPIYTQIVDRFRRDILSGTLAPGEKVPPVRELAITLGVNPNTLQRAMVELERMGLLFAERTTGRFVTTDEELISTLRQELIVQQVENFLREMSTLGCSIAQVKSLIASWEGKRNE